MGRTTWRSVELLHQEAVTEATRKGPQQRKTSSSVPRGSERLGGISRTPKFWMWSDCSSYQLTVASERGLSRSSCSVFRLPPEEVTGCVQCHYMPAQNMFLGEPVTLEAAFLMDDYE